MNKKEEVMELLTEFIQELSLLDDCFTGVIYTGGTITIADKERIIDISESMGVEIPLEMKEEDVLFIAFDDEDDDPDGYLQ